MIDVKQLLLLLLPFCIQLVRSNIISIDKAILKCYVDYRGTIHFNIQLKDLYKNATSPKAYFYYRKRSEFERDVKWYQESNCYQYRIKDDGNLNCTPNFLSRHKYLTFGYIVSVETNNKTINTSKLFMDGHRNVQAHPWTTMQKLVYCINGVGIKYFGLHLDGRNITLEWFRRPLDVEYIHSSPEITITNLYTNTTNPIFLRKPNCRKEACTYTFQSLRQCTFYRVCMSTKQYDFRRHECKTIRTQCFDESVNDIFRWQDILLIVFGTVIVIACISMTVVIRRNSKLIFKDNYKAEDDHIVPREELDELTQHYSHAILPRAEIRVNDGDGLYYTLESTEKF